MSPIVVGSAVLRVCEQPIRVIAQRAHDCECQGINPSEAPIRADVSCDLTFEIEEHASLAFQIAAANSAGDVEAEKFVVTLDGAPVPVEEIVGAHGGRVHLVSAAPGRLELHYDATLLPAATTEPPAVDPYEALVALRQSRYCPSDLVEGFAGAEFTDWADATDRGRIAGEWVFERLRYELGSSDAFDGALETLLRGEGVCRDFAHLTIALCRALDVPARLASAYAPGLSPMDFHAVAEVAIDGRWCIVDATRLAPRHSLLRIATGRDAADTAFCTTLSGRVELTGQAVSASTDTSLPLDDHVELVGLA